VSAEHSSDDASHGEPRLPVLRRRSTAVQPGGDLGTRHAAKAGARPKIDDEHRHAAAIAALGASPAVVRRILDGASAVAAWEQLRDGRHRLDPAGRYRGRAAAYPPEIVGAACARSDVDVVLRGDASYPRFLAADVDAPAVLFIAGAGSFSRASGGGGIAIGGGLDPNVGLDVDAPGPDVDPGSDVGFGMNAAGRDLDPGPNVDRGRGTDPGSDVGLGFGAGGVEECWRVAVVGTRAPTQAGERTAADLGRALASAGVVVVSGLARGIDAAAHRGALADGARTPLLGVLGAAVDAALAADAAALRSAVAKRGILLGEIPPGVPGCRWMFAVRNRIMAAAADVVVVVESHASGGSLHTVRAAWRRGVPVAVVPGSVHSSASAGTNALLVQGQAVAVRHVDDVLALLDECAGDAGTSRQVRTRSGVKGTRSGYRPPPRAASMAAKGEAASGVATTPTLRATRTARTARRGTGGRGDLPRVATPVGAVAKKSGPPTTAVLAARDGQSTLSARFDGSGHQTDAALPVAGSQEHGMAVAALAALDDQAASLDTLAVRSGLRLGEVALALERLARAGLADEEHGWWTRGIVDPRRQES